MWDEAHVILGGLKYFLNLESMALYVVHLCVK